MREKLAILIQKIEALSLRERVLVLVAVLIAVHQAWDSFVWRSLNETEDRLLAKEAATNDALVQTQVELKIISAKANRDPDKKTKQEIANLESQLNALKQQIDKTSESLMTPAEMAKLLEELLVAESGLELINLKTLDSVPLMTAGDKEKINTSYQIYRHGFSIEFSGSYLATLRYIQALENIKWRFFWDGIDYRVEEYPESRVRLNLYTLSLSEGWIGV